MDDNGAEFTLDIDASLRAALRGEHARIGQLEIEMDSALRPRDIQTRIRAGETPQAVAQAAKTTVEKIMAFAAPVLAERAHVAQRAQTSSLRRPAGDSGARTLGEAVGAHLRSLNVDPSQVEWDAWRREDGRWTLTGAFALAQRKGTATFAYDLRGSFVTSEDDDARWLVGEAVGRSAAAALARDDLKQARARRLSSVPADELPLGEDAIELVADEVVADEAPTDPAAAVAAPAEDVAPEPTPAEDEVEVDEQAGQSADPGAAVDPAAAEPASRRPARKGRGRASVPSWDEIMFGGPSDQGRG
ncbi:septation protein SepH [Nocardioides piscis]|uniref:septation protein SepH n=1 Tax=Nocardioides piscis TaxID=2714938 RepID=UPI001FEA5B39|nr:septation protein SepH [Nocardioides piscis]